MKQNTCCARCQIYLDYKDSYQCNDNDCPCHQLPTEEKCEEWCRRHCFYPKGDMREKIRTGLCPCACHASQDSLEWEIEFENKFGTYLETRQWIHAPMKTAIFAFIKEQITKAREQAGNYFIQEELPKAKEQERTRIRGVIDGNKEVYKSGSRAGMEKDRIDSCCNEVLTDILKEI